MVYTAILEDGTSMVMVDSVTAGSASDEAGIEAGDIILAVDGQDISVTADLMAIRRQHAIGDTIVLTVLRDDQTLDIPVVLRSNKK